MSSGASLGSLGSSNSGAPRAAPRSVASSSIASLRSSAAVTIPANTSRSTARKPAYQSVSRTRIVSPMAPSAHEPVPDATHGLDARPASRGVQLVTQPADEDIDHVGP